MLRKHTFRKIGISLALIVSVAGIVGLTMLLPRPVSAGTPYEDCLNNSGAPDVEAVVGACNSCFGNTSNGEYGVARGALWLGSRDSDVTTITKGTTTVAMTLWGTVYSCVQTGSGANPASHIWFASAGSVIGNSATGMLNNAVDFLSPNNASINMARGNGQGASNTWSSPPGSRSGITLDVEKFKNYSGTTEEVFERDGKTVHRYTATVSINRCYGNPSSYYNMSGLRNQACYGDDSRIVIEEVDPDIPDIPDPVPVEGQGWTADVEVTVLGRDGIEDHTVTSAKDLQAVIAVSADETFQVKFKHTMYFTPYPGPWDEGAHGSGKVVPPSCTNWSVTTTNGPSRNGELCADSVSGIDPTVIYEETVTVTPGDNSRNWVTSINNYSPKSYTYTVDHYTVDSIHHCSGNPVHCMPTADDIAIYTVTGSGSGSAGGAVSAVKPKDPEGNVQVGNSNPFIFTGQETAVSWDVTGTGWYERRIMSTQSPIYEVDDWATRSGNIAANKEREYSYDPCGYWSATQPGVIACLTPVGTNPYEDAQVKLGIPTITANPAGANFQIPDNVGDKFCTTYGYHWQYYWAHGENFSVGSQPTEEQFSNWAKEGGSKALYWFIFGSSCRAIVKKPTVALWNGGLLTNGGVSVSLATRYWPNASFGELAGGSTRSFSSWTEYLGVINGGVNNFGTGASYARGATGKTNPLTIANRDGDGGSGIYISTTFRTRLDTYLRTAASNSIDDMYDRSNTNNSTMIAVLSDPSGTNWITENIYVDGENRTSGRYDSIYQLPQNVIFVDGNLNIDPSVTQIDAWLIVNGDLNTCPSFVSGSTETAPGGSVFCDRQLIFNGPVLVAGTLTLNRTYGADPVLQGSQYTPAEVFNLSADSYLWAYAQAGRYGSSYTESYSRELAPRY